jgi:hypothetical protein
MAPLRSRAEVRTHAGIGGQCLRIEPSDIHQRKLLDKIALILSAAPLRAAKGAKSKIPYAKLEQFRFSWSHVPRDSVLQKRPVILSEAGKHGRSRRTSYFRGFSRGALRRRSRSCRVTLVQNTHRSSACASAPRKNPSADGGPSTPPVIPRFAQDDKGLFFGAMPGSMRQSKSKLL